MITAWLALEDIPGPNLRAALRDSIRQRLPLTVIVDARSTATIPTSERIAVLLKLRRYARRGGGDVILITDEKLRRSLRAAGLDTWLRITPTAVDALLIVGGLDGTPQQATAACFSPCQTTNQPVRS
jgi:hypothetical protein